MKTNISTSMGFLKPVTAFFKKYTALLPSIGITLAAVLLFIPTILVGGSVKEQMKESVKKAAKVTSLMRDVPSKDTPQQIERYMDRLDDASMQIDMLAAESSMRELISYNIFPPKGTSAELYITFGKEYRTAIENMIKSMNAKDAPSEAEIRSQTGEDSRSMGNVGRRAMSSNVDTVNPMVDAFCLKRSQEISVYANPSVFAWYNFWEVYEFQGQDQSLEDCWDSQVAFWIYEDIAETIRKMNEGNDTVSSSPVKRLLGISFSGPIVLESERSGGTRGARTQPNPGDPDKPEYLIPPEEKDSGGSSDESTVVESLFLSASLSERIGDEDVDITHLAVSVLVDNRFALAFMKELCSEKSHRYREGFKEDGTLKDARHNQITILRSDIGAVDKQAPEHEYYRYGNGAVMRLDLVCEYQFNRKGYDVIKPDIVKELLGQPVKEAGNGSQGQGGGGFPFN